MRSFNKILLCTQTINYLSSQLDLVSTELKFIAAAAEKTGLEKLHVEVTKKSSIETSEFLEEIGDRLNSIAQDIGDYMNNCDCIDDDTENVTNAAFEYLNKKESSAGS